MASSSLGPEKRRIGFDGEKTHATAHDYRIKIGPMIIQLLPQESNPPARLWQLDSSTGMVYPPVDEAAQKAAHPLDVSAAQRAMLPEKGITSRLERLL